MNIHIATFGKVVIDDQDSGDVFAACRANPSAAADIEQRAMAYVSRLAESDARVRQLDRDTNAATADRDRLSALLDSYAAPIKAFEDAQKTENEKALAAALAKKAEAEAEIAALTE